MPGPRTPLFSRKQPGGVYTIKNTGQGTGDDFYVHSSGSGDGFNPDSPVATIDAGINLCTASKGDTVHVMEGHAESIATAAAIAMDTVGVTIQGHGVGTDRPQITWTDTAATIAVTAANAVMDNIHFINSEDTMVVGIPVTAAHCHLTNCLFDDATAAEQTLHWVTGTAAADYLTIVDCEHHGSDTAGSTGFITLAAADHVRIRRLISHGDFAAANIDMSAACTDILIEDCALENANAIDVNIEGFANATGWIRYNSLRVATDTQVTWINTPGNMQLFENYGVNDDGQTGILAGTPSV